jgi:hypothetical protein
MVAIAASAAANGVALATQKNAGKPTRTARRFIDTFMNGIPAPNYEFPAGVKKIPGARQQFPCPFRIGNLP